MFILVLYWVIMNKKFFGLLGLGAVLGIVGHILNLLIIRPAVDSNSLSKQYNLVLINLVLVPSIAVVVIAVAKSLQNKKYQLVFMGVLALFILAVLVWYYSYPIVHPPIGL